MAQRLKPKVKQSQNTEQSISLKGSTKIVTEFFEYGLSSILYQRGLYPADDFKMVKKYGLNMLIPSDDSLKVYLTKITEQLSTWLNKRQVSRLVLAIIEKDSRETVERWQFDITLDDAPPVHGKHDKENQPPMEEVAPAASTAKPMTEAECRTQIQQVIKHICASNAFLPILDSPCTFNVLAYTNVESDVPTAWADSDAHLIQPGTGGGGVEHVKLRSFTTSIHRVEGLVAYRLGEEA